MNRAQRNIEWVEEWLRVPSGRFVGQPIILRPFQRVIFDGIYDGNTRTAIISFPRKNAKTTLAACLTILHTAGPEARFNSELYSTALSKEQAATLFKQAAKMVRMNDDLLDVINVRDHVKELYCKELGTLYTALSAEAKTAHGKNPAFVVHDELGQVRGPRSALFEAMETADGAHDEPLSIIISTQAESDGDLLSILIDDAKTGADKRIKLFFWSAPLDLDPFDPKTWAIANPGLGDILTVQSMKDAAEKARRMPSQEASFRNLKLNQRISQTSPFIPQAIWTACDGAPDLDVLRSKPVYGALDLSARNDLTAFPYMAQDDDGVWHVFIDFFAPEQGLEDRSRRDRVPYDVWAREGHLILCPGATVDYDWVAQRVMEVCDDQDVQVIGFDRWRFDVLVKAFERLGVTPPLRPFGQGYKDMSPAIDELEAALIGKKMLHGGHPILTWCAANAKATTDPAGNRKLDKTKATGRIDGIVALAMCFGVKDQEPQNPESVYEKRGLLEK